MAGGLKAMVSSPVAVVGGAIGVGIIIYALSVGRSGAPDVPDAVSAVSDTAPVTEAASGGATPATETSTVPASDPGAQVAGTLAAPDAGNEAQTEGADVTAQDDADNAGTNATDGTATAVGDDATGGEDVTAETESAQAGTDGVAGTDAGDSAVAADPDAATEGADTSDTGMPAVASEPGTPETGGGGTLAADRTVTGAAADAPAIATTDQTTTDEATTDPATTAPEAGDAAGALTANAENGQGDGDTGAPLAGLTEDGAQNDADEATDVAGATGDASGAVTPDGAGPATTGEGAVAQADGTGAEDAPEPDAADGAVAQVPAVVPVSPGLSDPAPAGAAPQTDLALLDRPKPVEPPATRVEAATGPDAADSVASVAPSQPQAVVLPPQVGGGDGVAPQFDLVRVDQSGSTVVAGRAAPNTDVEIIQNGKTVATVTASARGEFVALFNTDLSAQAQSLNLASRAEVGGPKVFSESSVIVLGRDLPEIDAAAGTVEAALPPAVIQATPEAVTVLQPVTGLADLENVSLDSISYDAQGEVVLAGRGRPGNVARAYVNDTVQVETAISDNGSWRVRMAGLLAGRYVLRIDEVDAGGKVVSRVESPFQRVYPSAENLDALGAERQVVIQRGDNLWNIARVRYGDGFKYSVIYDANIDQIRDPDLIYPGQIFDVPNSETGADDR